MVVWLRYDAASRRNVERRKGTQLEINEGLIRALRPCGKGRMDICEQPADATNAAP